MGKEVWVEMDEDKSATTFSPRKGVVLHVFPKSPEQQAAVVQLVPPALRLFPFPHRVANIILRYPSPEKDNLGRTFQKGHSYAEVLELKHTDVIGKDSFRKDDVARLGAASVFPWPQPSDAELSKMVGRPASASS